MNVVDVYGPVDDLPAKIIGRSVSNAALDAASGQPHGESVWIVVAAIVGLAAHETAAHLHNGRSPEFRAANNESFVEESARFQVLD